MVINPNNLIPALRYSCLKHFPLSNHKTLHFSTIARHGQIILQQPHTSPSVELQIQHISILFSNLKTLRNLHIGQGRVSQLSISEDSAIRIVLTLCRGSTLFPHPSSNSSCQPRPAIHGVCEVELPTIASYLLMLV